MSIIPMPGFAVVEIKKKYESGLSATKEKYATNSEGVMRAIHTKTAPHEESIAAFYSEYVDHVVYFAAFSDGETIKEDGKEYVLVPIEELRGAKTDA